MAKFEFGFEETWFRLIIKKLPDNPDLFQPKLVEKAQSILRVGKLKVGAAKVWAETAGIIHKKKQHYFLTPLGRLIAQHDPDFEEDGIWQAIHYNLARKESAAWLFTLINLSLTGLIGIDWKNRCGPVGIKIMINP